MPIDGFDHTRPSEVLLSTLDGASNIFAQRTRSGALAIQPPFASWIRMLNEPYGAATVFPDVLSTVGPEYRDSYDVSPLCLAMLQPSAIRLIFSGASSFCCT